MSNIQTSFRQSALLRTKHNIFIIAKDIDTSHFTHICEPLSNTYNLFFCEKDLYNLNALYPILQQGGNMSLKEQSIERYSYLFPFTIQNLCEYCDPPMPYGCILLPITSKGELCPYFTLWEDNNANNS